MTPDAAGIEAALAAGLAVHAHRWRGALLHCRQPCEWTASSGALPDRDQLAEHRAHVAAALLPVVTQAQEEALREAADRWMQGAWAGVMLPKPTPPAWPVIAYANRVGDWLRARADESGA